MKLSDKMVDLIASTCEEMIIHQAKAAIRQLKQEHDTYKAEVQALNKGVRSWEKSAMQKQAECTKYREALEKIEEGDESEIWETFPDVTYDEAVRLYAKQALEQEQ